MLPVYIQEISPVREMYTIQDMYTGRNLIVKMKKKNFLR